MWHAGGGAAAGSLPAAHAFTRRRPALAGPCAHVLPPLWTLALKLQDQGGEGSRVDTGSVVAAAVEDTAATRRAVKGRLDHHTGDGTVRTSPRLCTDWTAHRNGVMCVITVCFEIVSA